ncbi:MAG: hydantoinase B/oxoprolinase family protein, partial [Planctomycetes bacterium]|nr:hydantoinase B/oxoprolinase family protein [Planctomycetota bacterium]
TVYRMGGKATQIVTFGDGDIEPAFGLFGGGDGTLNFIELRKPDGTRQRPTTKDIVPGVPEGTVYVQEAGGGGGYGNPRERPAGRVLAEVQDGIISIKAAREVYGVAVNPSTLALDEKETAKLRGGKA